MACAVGEGMSMEYIRKHYGVPAKRGVRIRYTGSTVYPEMNGTIRSARGAYLCVQMDNENKLRTLHPTWEVEYLVNVGASQ